MFLNYFCCYASSRAMAVHWIRLWILLKFNSAWISDSLVSYEYNWNFCIVHSFPFHFQFTEFRLKLLQESLLSLEVSYLEACEQHVNLGCVGTNVSSAGVSSVLTFMSALFTYSYRDVAFVSLGYFLDQTSWCTHQTLQTEGPGNPIYFVGSNGWYANCHFLIFFYQCMITFDVS